MSRKATKSVLCPVCETAAASVDATTCATCNGALVLHERFVIERLLGAGGQSRVYRARDRQTGTAVAMKIMALSRTRDLKSVELFRRSAGVLAGLSHPAVPRLVDYFEEVRPTTALYCLAHELIDGETLAELQARGVRFAESDVRGFARELLAVLQYLHGLSPPVIHRDIKPSNLMQRRGGGLVLIDFDLVRDVLRPDGGSTMSAGTAGYTPLEQYTGDATPATDLYALGVTLAVLLSRRAPLDLRRPGEQRLDIARHVNVDASFVRVLERMTEPEPTDRFQTARDVLAALERPVPAPPSAPTPEASPEIVWPRDDSNGRGRAAALFVAVFTAIGGLIALFESRKQDPPAAPAPPPLASHASVAPPVRKTPKRDKLRPRQPATDLDPSSTEALLVAQPWETKLDGFRTRYTFASKGKRFVATRVSFTDDGRVRESVDYDVELYTLGSLALRHTFAQSGFTVAESIFADLTTSHRELTGESEKRYTGATPSIETARWSARAVRDTVKTP